MTGRGIRGTLAVLALLTALAAAIALAFWSAAGGGVASASSGSLAPATITVPASGLTTVTVTWTQQASLAPASAANSAVTYSLERRLGAGSFAAVSSGDCSGPTSYGVTSCSDAPPASGAYRYRVVASYRSWTATSTETGPVAFTLDTTAPVVVAEVTPAPNAAGWNRTSPVAVALIADDVGGSGVAGIAYTTDGSDPSTSPTAQPYAAPLSIAATTTVRYRATDLAGNASPVQSQLVKVDVVPPASAITLTGVSGGAFKSGATVYYRGLAAGSFRLTDAVSDGGSSGPASSATAALSGLALGWTLVPSVVTTPAGGPYVSSVFSWSAFSTSSPTEIVTGSDAAGNTVTTTLTLTDDSVPPVGGTVDATGLGGIGGRDSTSMTLAIAFSPGTDAGSGLATGAQLLRASAPLADGSCGTYGAYAQVGANDPVSPAASTVPVDHTCYRYRYVVLDRVGNTATSTSPDIRVDTAAAHPDFLQPITSPEGVRPGPAGLAVGDIDNDGDQDIVTSNLLAVTTSVLINDGVGAFREITVLSNAPSADAGLGKFDNDANLDLVLLYPGTPPATGLLVIFKGGGDGTFTYQGAVNALVATGVRSSTLVVGNFNGDAIDDVAVVNSQNSTATEIGTVTTYLGNPAGNDAFAAATPAQTLTAQIGTADIAYADFNGGARDLVVTNYASGSVSLMSGNGTGFNAPVHIAAGAAVLHLDTSQVDAGTTRDIVATIANSSPTAVRTLFGDGTGGFPTQVTTTAATVATGTTPQALVVRDFDGDGDVDVAIANGVQSTVSLLANDGTGVFTIAPASPETGVGAPSTLPYRMASADFDGSGFADLMVSILYTDPGRLRLLLNQNGPKADLSITLADSPDPVNGGQNLSYTLTVANAGPGTPSQVKARSRLPAGVTFNAAASSPSCSAAGTAPVTVTCAYGAVAPGSPEALQIVVNTNASTPPSLASTATVGANLADPAPADNIASATTTVLDVTGPSGGSVDASGLVGTGGRYSTSTTLTILLAKGTDPSGLAASGARLRRSTGTLSSGGTANGACSGFAASVQVGADDPVSPVTDTVPAGPACYRYEYIVADAVGNSTTYTSPDIKVDTSAPAAPSLAFSAFTNTSWNGTTLFYRATATSGAFTVTASAMDPASGIAGYAFPTLPTGWTSTPGALGVNSHGWSVANPTAPSGAQSVTATNHATLTSPGTAFTMVSDTTAPATGSVAYTEGYVTSPSLSVTFGQGTDGGSGVNGSSGLLQRAEATLSGGTCATYGAFATLAGGTNPTSPFTDAGVVTGTCYQYRYLVSDNVANQATYTSAGVAKVDSTPPAIVRAVAVKADGSTPGTIRQGGTFYLYAQVTDANGVVTVTANAGTFDTGVTAASLSTSGGPWTVGGLTYSHRGALLTADIGLRTGVAYAFTVSATDTPGNVTAPTPFSATIETYYSVVTATAGLVSYWRFNDGAVGADDFTDTAGTLLSAHVGAVGATWTTVPGQARTAVISAAGRVRRETGDGAAHYYASGVPSGANNIVEGDVFVASLLATDTMGVTGRQDISGTGQTFYLARYVVSSTRWELAKVVAGTLTLIGTGTGTGFYTQTLTVGSSYRVGLQMNGTTISLQVAGVTRITATDSAISASGRAGVATGTSAGTAQASDSAGLHLDGFEFTGLTAPAADSRGANHGTYVNGAVLNEPGALAGDNDRAARLDGTNDYVTVPDATSLDLGDGPFTYEAWIKRSSVNILGVTIFHKGTNGTQIGLLLDALFIGKDAFLGSIVSSTTSLNGTAWHHLVVTKSGSAVKIYLDGVDRTGLVGNQTILDTASALIFGAKSGTGEFLAATIDEFAVYNVVLSAATVVDHYQAGVGTG